MKVSLVETRTAVLRCGSGSGAWAPASVASRVKICPGSASQDPSGTASPDLLPLMRAGSIKAYAVTSDTRLTVAPGIPTEMGVPALSRSFRYGLFAPKGTPGDIIGKLNASAVEVLTDPGVRSRLADLGMEVFPRERQTPEALGALVKADAEKWRPLIKEFGIKAE